MPWILGWIASCFLPCINDHKMASSCAIVRTATFDKRTIESLNNNEKNNLPQPIKNCSKRHRNEESTTKDEVVNDIEDSKRSFFSEEDFIVFDFEEDGPFDVVKDDKGVVHRYARPFIFKDGKQDDKCKHINNIERKEIEDYEKMMSIESRDSVHSTGSFAFPVLDNSEWIGSPAQMPKSEGPQQLKKNQVNSMRF